MKKPTKVILITGASAGIGKTTARMLNQQGWTVYAAARRLEAMGDLANLGIKTQPLDITEPQQCQQLVETIIANEGRIDALVNNAGYGSYGPLEMVADTEARRQFDVNIFGLMHLTRLVIPHMREQHAGRIINISSIGGRLTAPMGGWYHATKFALEALSDTLRAELRPFGIAVSVIQPGNISSEWADIAADHLGKAASDNPYQQQIQAMSTSLKQGTKESKGLLATAPPEVIGKLVIRIIKAQRPKTRYAAPFHAKLFLFLRWLLSDRIFDRIMEQQIAKLAKQTS